MIYLYTFLYFLFSKPNLIKKKKKMSELSSPHRYPLELLNRNTQASRVLLGKDSLFQAMPPRTGVTYLLGKNSNSD